MKIGNKEVGIQIGNRKRTFTNMILNNYLDLFVQSFTQFQPKDLTYCLVNISHHDNFIDENSTEMKYDIVLESDGNHNVEIYTNNTIINKYYYKNISGESTWNDYLNRPILNLGFARYNPVTEKYVLYAFLDVSRYNIVIQPNQPIVISRIDQVQSDMDMWVNNPKIQAPIHLTTRGLLEYAGMNYFRTISKFYSVGFGVLPYTLNKEYLAEDLTIEQSGTELLIKNLETGLSATNLFFHDDLYMSDDLIMQKPSYPYIIYKFKLYNEVYEDLEEEPTYVDTGMFYTQYKKLTKQGKINASIKYERG